MNTILEIGMWIFQGLFVLFLLALALFPLYADRH